MNETSIMSKKIRRYYGYYANDSEAFNRGLLPDISRTIKANKADACVVIEYEPIKF